jgi:hypothetical protein
VENGILQRTYCLSLSLRQFEVELCLTRFVSEPVKAKNKKDQPLPQNAIGRPYAVSSRYLKRRFVQVAGYVATQPASQRVVRVAHGILTSVEEMVQC